MNNLFFFFSRERRQEANEARVVASYAPPSVFFMSIIKRQIKTLSSSTVMSSISLFSLRKNLIQTFNSYSVFFQLCSPRLHIYHHKDVDILLIFFGTCRNDIYMYFFFIFICHLRGIMKHALLPSKSMLISENINVYVFNVYEFKETTETFITQEFLPG